MTSNRDLRKFQDSDVVADAFAKLISGGKPGYKTIMEKNKPPIRCLACHIILEGIEKFCPECGMETNFKQ